MIPNPPLSSSSAAAAAAADSRADDPNDLRAACFGQFLRADGVYRAMCAANAPHAPDIAGDSPTPRQIAIHVARTAAREIAAPTSPGRSRVAEGVLWSARRALGALGARCALDGRPAGLLELAKLAELRDAMTDDLPSSARASSISGAGASAGGSSTGASSSTGAGASAGCCPHGGIRMTGLNYGGDGQEFRFTFPLSEKAAEVSGMPLGLLMTYWASGCSYMAHDETTGHTELPSLVIPAKDQISNTEAESGNEAEWALANWPNGAVIDRDGGNIVLIHLPHCAECEGRNKGTLVVTDRARRVMRRADRVRKSGSKLKQ